MYVNSSTSDMFGNCGASTDAIVVGATVVCTDCNVTHSAATMLQHVQVDER